MTGIGIGMFVRKPAAIKIHAKSNTPWPDKMANSNLDMII